MFLSPLVKHVILFSHSASLLFPTPGPHGQKGGLLREARAVAGVLRVRRHPGLLQGTRCPTIAVFLPL